MYTKPETILERKKKEPTRKLKRSKSEKLWTKSFTNVSFLNWIKTTVQMEFYKLKNYLIDQTLPFFDFVCLFVCFVAARIQLILVFIMPNGIRL